MEEQKPVIRIRELTPEEQRLEKMLFYRVYRLQLTEEMARKLAAVNPRPLPKYIPNKPTYGAD